ncbi:hypothetical protein D3C86_1709130 [compost metagenome]
MDIVFSVREDVDEPSPEVSNTNAPHPNELPAPRPATEARRQPSSPPAPGIEAFREAAAAQISDRLGRRLIRRRRSLFESSDGKARVVVAVSKRYDRSYQAYWYAYYDTQKAWLDEAEEAWIAFCATDTGDIYLVPAAEIAGHLSRMNVTSREADRAYWHVQIRLADEAFVLVAGEDEVPLKRFRL